MLGIAVVASTLSCSNQKQQESPMKAKVEEYAPVEMKTSIFQ